MKKMQALRIVYLAHPYSNNPTNNMKKVNMLAISMIEKEIQLFGTIRNAPLIPHNMLLPYKEEGDVIIRRITEIISKRMVAMCDELWICSRNISQGMSLEIIEAKRNGIPIRDYDYVREYIHW